MGTHAGTVLLGKLIFPQIIVQNNPLLIHIPSEMNLVPTLLPHSSKNRCNITTTTTTNTPPP